MLMKRLPTHPGEILDKDFLKPLGISQSELSKDLGTSFRTINEIVNEKRGISPDMAIRLARYFKTSEELWLNMQMQYDLYWASEKDENTFERIRPYSELHKKTEPCHI